MGQSGSIIKECEARGITLTRDACEIQFSSPDRVSQFGATAKGELEPNPDLAGQGVLIAFLVPSIIVCAFALFLGIARAISFFGSWQDRRAGLDAPLSKGSSSRWFHDTFDDLICSAGDAQLLLILTYGAAFKTQSQCEVSSYHYNVAIHTVLAGLASSALGMLIVRNARQKLITGLARIAVFVVCLVGLFGLKPLRDSMADVDLSRPSPFRNRLPGPQQGDSVIVLPAYCFLDASFDPMEALSDDERDHLAHNGLQSNAAVQAILIMLIFIAVALSKYIFGLRARWDISESNKAGGRVCGGDGSLVGYIIIAFLKFIAWGIVIGLVAWNWASIFLLRDWAEKSGWLRLDDGWNEERDVQGLGQIAPLIALGAIGVVITDALSQFTAPKEDNNVVVTAQAPQSPVHANSFPLQNLTSQTRGRQGYSQIPHPV